MNSHMVSSIYSDPQNVDLRTIQTKRLFFIAEPNVFLFNHFGRFQTIRKVLWHDYESPGAAWSLSRVFTEPQSTLSTHRASHGASGLQ